MQPSASLADKEAGTKKSSCARCSQATNMADIGTKVLERDTIQEHVEKSGMCPLRPVESGDSWSSWCVHGHRHIHISAELPSVQSIQTLRKGRKTLLQVELDRERPHLSAMTLVLGAKAP